MVPLSPILMEIGLFCIKLLIFPKPAHVQLGKEVVTVHTTI